MTKALNYVDLCFVIDTTGSMGSFIQAAKQQLLDTIQLLSADSDIDLQVGLVEYRDHPPQDSSFVTRVYPLRAIIHNCWSSTTVRNFHMGDQGFEP